MGTEEQPPENHGYDYCIECMFKIPVGDDSPLFHGQECPTNTNWWTVDLEDDKAWSCFLCKKRLQHGDMYRKIPLLPGEWLLEQEFIPDPKVLYQNFLQQWWRVCVSCSHLRLVQDGNGAGLPG